MRFPALASGRRRGMQFYARGRTLKARIKAEKARLLENEAEYGRALELYEEVLALNIPNPELLRKKVEKLKADWAIKGEEAVLVELSNELSSKKWKNSKVPGEQLKRLRAIESDQRQPKPWRTVARFLLGLRPEA